MSPADGIGSHSLRRSGFWVFPLFFSVYFRLLFDSGMERFLKLCRRQLMSLVVEVSYALRRRLRQKFYRLSPLKTKVGGFVDLGFITD